MSLEHSHPEEHPTNIEIQVAFSPQSDSPLPIPKFLFRNPETNIAMIILPLSNIQAEKNVRLKSQDEDSVLKEQKQG